MLGTKFSKYLLDFLKLKEIFRDKIGSSSANFSQCRSDFYEHLWQKTAAAIDAMAERQEKARVDDLHAAIANDPGLKADHDAIESEMKELNDAAIAAGQLPTPDDDAWEDRTT